MATVGVVGTSQIARRRIIEGDDDDFIYLPFEDEKLPDMTDFP